MEIIIYLAIWLGMAYWCSVLAKRRGRNEVLSVFLGFLFGIFAVIGYAIVPTTEEKKIEDAKKILKEKERILKEAERSIERENMDNNN